MYVGTTPLLYSQSIQFNSTVLLLLCLNYPRSDDDFIAGVRSLTLLPANRLARDPAGPRAIYPFIKVSHLSTLFRIKSREEQSIMHCIYLHCQSSDRATIHYYGHLVTYL